MATLLITHAPVQLSAYKMDALCASWIRIDFVNFGILCFFFSLFFYNYYSTYGGFLLTDV